MKVYIVKCNYDYEGFDIDSTWAHEDDAIKRVAEIERIIGLPFDHINHKYICDDVDYECLDVKRKGFRR